MSDVFIHNDTSVRDEYPVTVYVQNSEGQTIDEIQCDAVKLDLDNDVLMLHNAKRRNGSGDMVLTGVEYIDFIGWFQPAQELR